MTPHLWVDHKCKCGKLVSVPVDISDPTEICDNCKRKFRATISVTEVKEKGLFEDRIKK